jgi:CrcB protein
MQSFLAVGGGAALGAWLRWGLGLALNPVFGGFPLGTWVANLVGGLLMGVALAVFQSLPELPPHLKLLCTTGFLGGLTTFSSFPARYSRCCSAATTPGPQAPSPRT